MAERDLSARTSLALCVIDGDGRFVSSSAKHAARLGRSVDGIVGTSWRQWSAPAQLDESERLVARVLAGAEERIVVLGQRLDGLVSISRLHLMPTQLRDGRPGVIGLHTGVIVTRAAAASEAPPPLGLMMADVAEDLARMAERSGLFPLADSLEAVARQGVAATLRQDPIRLS